MTQVIETFSFYRGDELVETQMYDLPVGSTMEISHLNAPLNVDRVVVATDEASFEPWEATLCV